MSKVVAFDHVLFWVTNSRTAASYYITRLGFQPLAIKEPSKDYPYLTYVVKQNKIIFAFLSPANEINEEFTKQVNLHGDFVKDVAFTVNDLDKMLEIARSGGATVLRDIHEESDEHGVVRMAKIKTYADTIHTFVDRSLYNGPFLPGFKLLEKDPINDFLPPINFEYIDHVEADMLEGEMDAAALWYEKVLRMHRFWCIDYKTDWRPYSNISHKSVVNDDESVIVAFKDSAHPVKENHASIYLDGNKTSGVEHIALLTKDMIGTIKNLLARGAEMVEWPSTYYDIVKEKLTDTPVKIEESIDDLKKYNILLDYDENGYMFHTFTKHTQPRSTVFIEVIFRKGGHKGFGAANYKRVHYAMDMIEKAKENEARSV